MNSAQAAKSMQQLLSMWAEAYGSQVSSTEEAEVERFSTPPSSPDDNDEFLRQVSGLLDKQFRQLEDQTFKPLFEAVEELNRSEGSVVIEVQRGKRYKVAPGDLMDRRREKEVVVDSDPAVVRELQPKPCHKFYLAKSGCRHPGCTHSHAYKLNKGHLKYMRQLCETLVCQALKIGVPCKEGENCIYQHKCSGGFGCTWGDKCRFFNIPGARPDPGQFHKKKNYYDGSKGGKSESKEQVNGDGWSYGRDDEIEEVKFSSW